MFVNLSFSFLISFLFVCPNHALRMFAGCYAHDNQGVQQSETAQNHSRGNAVSFWPLVKLGENLEYFILLGSWLLSCFLKLGLCICSSLFFRTSQTEVAYGSILPLETLRNTAWLVVPIQNLTRVLNEEVIIAFLWYQGFQGRNRNQLGSQSFPTGKRIPESEWSISEGLCILCCDILCNPSQQWMC